MLFIKNKLWGLAMSSNILFERDVLFPTDDSNYPGSIRLKVFDPDKNAKIPVFIEAKSNHSPLKYIDTILRMMQSDIFDRIFIDIKKNVDINIIVSAEIMPEYANFSHVKLSFYDGGFKSEGVNL